jgi:peptidoglycan/LPS O-acetylase OafA/YrhL
MLTLTNTPGVFGRIMRWNWLARLGEIGYCVYLFHVGIYIFCMLLLAGHGWRLASWSDFGVTLIALAITLGFAKLSWKYFEKPIVKWGHRWHY